MLNPSSAPLTSQLSSDFCVCDTRLIPLCSKDPVMAPLFVFLFHASPWGKQLGPSQEAPREPQRLQERMLTQPDARDSWETNFVSDGLKSVRCPAP